MVQTLLRKSYLFIFIDIAYNDTLQNRSIYLEENSTILSTVTLY